MLKTRRQPQPLASRRGIALLHDAVAAGHVHILLRLLRLLLRHLHLLPLDLLPVARSTLSHQLPQLRGTAHLERAARVVAAQRPVHRGLLLRRRALREVVQHALADGAVHLQRQCRLVQLLQQADLPLRRLRQPVARLQRARPRCRREVLAHQRHRNVRRLLLHAPRGSRRGRGGGRHGRARRLSGGREVGGRVGDGREHGGRGVERGGGLQGGGRQREDVGLQLEDALDVGGAVAALWVDGLDGDVEHAQRLLARDELRVSEWSERYGQLEEEGAAGGELLGGERGVGDEPEGILLMRVRHAVQVEGDLRGVAEIKRSDNLAEIPLYGE